MDFELCGCLAFHKKKQKDRSTKCESNKPRTGDATDDSLRHLQQITECIKKPTVAVYAFSCATIWESLVFKNWCQIFSTPKCAIPSITRP